MDWICIEVALLSVPRPLRFWQLASWSPAIVTPVLLLPALWLRHLGAGKSLRAFGGGAPWVPELGRQEDARKALPHAGQEEPSEGEIRLDGNRLNDVSASERDTPMVWQSLALFPFLNVFNNVEFGLKMRGVKTIERRRKVMEWLERLEISAYAEREISQLSGGQRQTLAIARAIYFGAKVLILDEPTSALGQKQQMEVLKTILKVRDLGNIAIILITHNEIHARLVADRFTFLSLGEVIGSGTPKNLKDNDIKRLMAGGAEIGDLAAELQR